MITIMSLLKEQVGTILEVYEDNNYEGEISDIDEITLFFDTISGDYLQSKKME